jgi:hypothetical protein
MAQARPLAETSRQRPAMSTAGVAGAVAAGAIEERTSPVQPAAKMQVTSAKLWARGQKRRRVMPLHNLPNRLPQIANLASFAAGSLAPTKLENPTVTLL